MSVPGTTSLQCIHQHYLLNIKAYDLGVIQNCHHFHERTQLVRWGGREGVKGHCTFKQKLILFMVCINCNFEKESQNQHFQSTLLVGRGWVTKKEYSVYALDNVDNSGRTLTFFFFPLSFFDNVPVVPCIKSIDMHSTATVLKT